MKPSDKRRKLRLVDRRFQLGLAWRMLVAFLLFFVVGIFLVFAPSMIALLTGTDLEKLGPASEEFLILHRRIWPAVLVVIAGVFVYTLVFSHRIAGPIYRINSALQMMLKGEYPKKVTLRKGDHFQSTAELLEALARQLAGRSGAGTGGRPADPGASGEPR